MKVRPPAGARAGSLLTMNSDPASVPGFLSAVKSAGKTRAGRLPAPEPAETASADRAPLFEKPQANALVFLAHLGHARSQAVGVDVACIVDCGAGQDWR